MTVINAENLKRGDCILWLGRVRPVKTVRRSLGDGWVVTFENGLTANMYTAHRVASAPLFIEAPDYQN